MEGTGMEGRERKGGEGMPPFEVLKTPLNGIAIFRRESP